jgi:hypothetical protein
LEWQLMPVVTPFGEFALDDEVALQRYIDAHARRHHTYIPLTGVAGGNLRGNVDGDWMHRHAARTISLATVTGVDLSSADTKVLALPGKWRTQEELDDWMALDARIHLKIDQQLGL